MRRTGRPRDGTDDRGERRRSITYEPGHPEYTGADLVGDAAGVLDAYEVSAAHVVGVSAGGAFAQLLGLEFAERVRSLVLISTSPAMQGDRDLPSPTDAFGRFVSTAEVDWSDQESVIEYLVAYSRLLAGGRRPFDEIAMRELVRRDVERARNFGAAQNHDLFSEGEVSRGSLSSITAPTLVIHGTADPVFHGTADPVFPHEHGDALVAEIPGATLPALEDAGHGVDRADWAAIIRGILEHTASADRDSAR